MKKLYIYMASLATMLALGACNKELNLKPYQQIEQSQAILTSTDVQITLVGAYNRAGLADLYGGGIFVDADLLAAKNLTFGGTYQDLIQMYRRQILVNNSFVNATWLDAYRVINQANNVIANIDKAGADVKDSYEGQAKFLRGLTYFDLARMYGKAWGDGDEKTNLAVPLVLTPTTDVNASSFPARSTVNQIYDQAISDLKEAENKLGEDADFFANKFSASAILARLYLQKGDFANAANEANTVIESGSFSLVANYANEFHFPLSVPAHFDNTTEDVFAIQVTNQVGVNALNTYYASKSNSGRGDIIIDDDFLDSFEANDSRAKLYSGTAGRVRTDKFNNQYANVVVIRLAELYLIRAEANLHLTVKVGTATPLEDINIIRNRAGVAPLTTVALSDVYTEREHELAFEGGFFLHDAKRLKTKLGSLEYNAPKLIFPIPQLETNANKNLVQNEGY